MYWAEVVMLPSPPPNRVPDQIAHWALNPACSDQRLRSMRAGALAFFAKMVQQATMRPEWEMVLFRAHINEALSCLTSQFEEYLVRSAAADRYYREKKLTKAAREGGDVPYAVGFRPDFLELTLDRDTGELLLPKDYANKYVTATKNRILDGFKSKKIDPRDPRAQPAEPARPDVDVAEAETVAKNLSLLRQLAEEAADGNPTRLSALWMRIEGASSSEVIAALGIPANRERTWWCRFTVLAVDRGLIAAK